MTNEPSTFLRIITISEDYKRKFNKEIQGILQDDSKDNVDFDIELVSDKYAKVISSYDGFIIEGGWRFCFERRSGSHKACLRCGIGGKNSKGLGVLS